MWNIEPSSIPGLFNVYDKDGNRIAKNLTKDMAMLIAKAPQMFELLRRFLAHPSDDWQDAIKTEEGHMLTPKQILEHKAHVLIAELESDE